jgi:hypothetical protein
MRRRRISADASRATEGTFAFSLHRGRGMLSRLRAFDHFVELALAGNERLMG